MNTPVNSVRQAAKLLDPEPQKTPQQIHASYAHDEILDELYATKAQINREADYSVEKIFARLTRGH